MGLAVDTGATKVLDASFTNPIDGAAVKIEVSISAQNSTGALVNSSIYIVIDEVQNNVLAEYPAAWPAGGDDTKIFIGYIGGLSIGTHSIQVFATGSGVTKQNCTVLLDFRFN